MYGVITSMKPEPSGYPTVPLSQQFQSDREHGETSEFPDYEPKATFYSL